ncbi:MAG: hypothetical protein P1P67_10765 [Treponema phagedenis]|nr:hypothetical protein [Treponema phagedenis]QKS92116.1 hypothetical protein HPJ96_05770 [Treponema phagedenis]
MLTKDAVRSIILSARIKIDMKIDLEKELAVFKPSGDEELITTNTPVPTGWSMLKDLKKKLKSSKQNKKNPSASNKNFTHKEIPSKKDS